MTEKFFEIDTSKLSKEEAIRIVDMLKENFGDKIIDTPEDFQKAIDESFKNLF